MTYVLTDTQIFGIGFCLAAAALLALLVLGCDRDGNLKAR